MRVAFVVQRYGEDIGGGAEALCRWVAERMQRYFEVSVLTTCALDYLTWANHFPAGAETINGVPVQRFPVDEPRDIDRFNRFARRLFRQERRTLVEELEWIRRQGPLSSGLLDAIRRQEDHVDLFVFITYSYLTTFLGLQLVPTKSLLIPAAHDEPHFAFTAFQPIFHLPRGILYNTPEEKLLVQRTWRNQAVPCRVAGAGVARDPASGPERDDQGTTPEPPLDLPDSPYLLYVGRVDVMKGCQELIDFFLRFTRQMPDVDLVLLGKPAMELPPHPRLHALGFVSEAHKAQALQQAAVLVNPSAYESLSLVILEAWQQGIPVLVNGRSDVLAGHCAAANGGLYYTNYDEFALCLDLLLRQPDVRRVLGDQGKRYVDEHYSWDTIEQTYVDFIQQIGTASLSAAP